MCSKKIFTGALWTFVTAFSLNAATAPFSENFDDQTAEFSTPRPADWSVIAGSISGDFDFQNSFTSTGAASTSTASLDFTGSLGGVLKNDWSMSTDFKLDIADTAGSGITVGLGALGMTNNFAGGSPTGAYYLADVLVTGGTVGRVRVLEVSTSNTYFVTDTTSGVAINTTDTYRFTLQGTYEGNNLRLTLTLENLTTPNPTTGVGKFTISGIDDSPLVGTYFGYRNRLNGGGTLDANFDNFSLVPEPSAAVLLGVGALGLCARRRRA